MKAAFLVVLAVGTIGSARIIVPEEYDASRIKYLTYLDANGDLRVENLMERRIQPRTVNDDVKFLLFTRNNIQEPEVIRGGAFEDLLKSKYFDPTKRCRFTIHGWNGNAEEPINSMTKEAILFHEDVNIFVVDWSVPASKFYTTAKGSVPQVGAMTGNFIGFIIENFGKIPDDFDIVGFSLGAHVAGTTGSTVKRTHGPIRYIVGLDPAGPMYSLQDTEDRIDETDATFVQIVHTNGGGLGLKSSLGHADYYPNGGSSQPGCGLDFLGGCAHNKAPLYYGDSIFNGGFTSQQCPSYKDYENGSCKNNHSSRLGGLMIDLSARGDYFLKTNTNAPYSLD